MSEFIYYFIGIAVSAPLCMKLSAKYDWSKKHWDMLNKKISESFNVGIWLIGSIIFQRIVEEVAKMITSDGDIVKLITGISLGFAFSFMPRKNFKTKV
ncbi:MAG: hypothetical protein WBA54_03445 [Acidaminobacteraceae bacterium]|jgi:hypothetical protein